MNPKIENYIKKNGITTFTLAGINVSIANSIRRTILSDIKTVVFKTTPYEENNCNIIKNTSRFHNEIIKQRLSCIPIHITDLNMPIENYILELDVENNTDTTIYVTTNDFKIKNILTEKYLNKEDTLNIFPPNLYTNTFIDFLRLRPKLSNEIPGERIQLTSKFSYGTAKQDGMFNVVSNCSYGFTPDYSKIEVEENKMKETLKGKNMTKEEVVFELSNWRLLDAMRITKQDSFDFIIESVGVFTNGELLEKACDNIIERLDNINKLNHNEELDFKKSNSTINNCFDIILNNEDYTIGKIIEYVLYSKYFEGLKKLTYCGFKKMHPHDTYSIIRIAYYEEPTITILKENLNDCLLTSIKLFEKIKQLFNKYN